MQLFPVMKKEYDILSNMMAMHVFLLKHRMVIKQNR